MAKTEGADFEGEVGEMAFPPWVDDAHWRAVDVDGNCGLEWANDERHEVGGHHHCFGESNEILADTFWSGRARKFRCVGNGEKVFVDNQRNRKGCFVGGFVPAGEGAACIGGFELRRSDDLFNTIGIGECGSVEAAEFVVEFAVEPNAEMRLSGGNWTIKGEGDSLFLGVKGNPGHRNRCAGITRSFDEVGGQDVEIEGVARDGVGWGRDQNGNEDLASKGGSFEVWFEGELVTDGSDGAVEAKRVGFAVMGEKFSIGHGASVWSDAMTALLPPSDRSLDVLCVGNAIVDVLAQTDDSFLETHGMVKGSMQLTDPDRARSIYSAMPPAVEISGGSAANTAAGLASLDSSVAFIGKVADDELGEVFAHDIRAAGVAFHGFPATGAEAAAGTARCLICVTPDAQRTMNTSLGVAGQLTTDDIDLSLVPTARVVYLEGYLWDEPAAKSALRNVMGWAAGAGTRVAFTLSDGFCVDRHRAEFLEIIEHHVDILFANEDEICSLYEVDDFDEAARRVAGHCAIACLTRGDAGSVIISSDGERVDVSAVPAELLDTTGAGDLYAAGFLAAWVRGADLLESGRTGSIVAAEAISHLGARPQVNLSVLVKGAL